MSAAAGDYVDEDDQLSIFVHRARNGNFVEAIGRRDIVNVAATAAPFASLPTVEFVIKKLSNVVSLQVPDIIATSNTTSGSTLVFPGVVSASARPRRTLKIPITMQNNATLVMGYATVASSTGSVTFQLVTGTWANAAQAGVNAIDLNWDSATG